MQTDKILIDALSGLELPINRVAAKYRTVEVLPEQYFIYSITGGTASYGDDYLENIQMQYAIMLFSKNDYSDILHRTIAALNTGNITIQSFGAEFYDPDIDFYQIQINVSVFEDWEES